MSFCADNEKTLQVCAILHDVIEYTNITFDDIRTEGFSDGVIATLDCLTKRDNESYDAHLSYSHK